MRLVCPHLLNNGITEFVSGLSCSPFLVIYFELRFIIFVFGVKTLFSDPFLVFFQRHIFFSEIMVVIDYTVMLAHWSKNVLILLMQVPGDFWPICQNYRI